MKRLPVLMILTAMSFQTIFAQEVDDSLRYAESIWSMEKKALILDEMNLTEAEKSSFWPVYESYSNAIQYLEMEYIRLVNYVPDDEWTDRDRESLTESILLNELLLAKTRKQYFKKFVKALSPAQASKFMKLDHDFRTMLRLQMQKETLPLVSSNRIRSIN